MDNNLIKNSSLYLLIVAFVLLLGGCENSTSPEESGHSNDIEAFIWAFDDDSGRVSIYDVHNEIPKNTYTASAFSMMHCFMAGPATEPTVWMAKSNKAYAFTGGFDLSHGDHAHKEAPMEYAAIAVGNNPVHMGSTPSGDSVAFANDGDGTVSIIDVITREVVQTCTHGSGHSSALLTGEYLITTPATASGETWAKIIDITRDSILDSLDIGAGAHGDAYYAAEKKAFIAITDGIAVIDVAARAVSKTIPYTETGRTNFLYHGHNNRFAAGLHKTDSGTSDKLLILDMASDKLEYLAIPNASLPWNISKGQFALSADGTAAVISDNVALKIYHVTLATKAVKTLNAPAAACAVATDENGTFVWALAGSNVSMFHVAENRKIDTFPVDQGVDWIYVTSTTVEAVQ